jgi:DNA-binding NarL/FixJ family response regulator
MSMNGRVNLPGQATPSSLRPNSVNLSQQALDALLDKLDEPESKGGAKVRRSFVRWPFRRTTVVVEIIHPGGNTVSIRAAARNLSNGGICLLHSAFIHAGSDCIVHLPHASQGDVEVRGKIVRCMHRAGVIHEIGIAFARSINAKEFLDPDPLSNSFAVERIRPSDLQGRLLLIDHSKMDRDVLKHFLRETSLSVECAETLADGVVKCENFDIVIMSSELPDAMPSHAVAKLRAVGHSGPIIMMVPDDTARTRSRVAATGVRAFLTRPITQELVLRALGEVLLCQHATPERNTDHGTRAKSTPTDEVTRIGKALFTAVFNRDIAAIRAACQRVRALAQTRNWTHVLAVVSDVQAKLARGEPLEVVLPSLEAVIAACDSAEAPARRSA